MAYQVVIRGRGGRRPIENFQVMRLMQGLESRLHVIEGDKQRDLIDAIQD